VAVPDYSLGDVARILKVSPRRLRYWQQTSLLPPDRVRGGGRDLVSSAEQAAQEGGYAFRDLVVLRAIVALLDRGIPLQRIRRNIELLRERLPDLDDPAAALRLLDDPSPRLVVRRDGVLEETGGQLLLAFEDDQSGVREGAVASLSDFESSVAQGARASKRAEDAIFWFERGCELDAEAGRSAEAIEAYETALELEPDYADAFCNLGAVRYNQGQRAEARRAFEACLRREADHVEANFNLANVLEEEGDDAGALAHYRRALAADPLYADLHINMALLYEKMGRARLSCDHWRRYLQLEPSGSWSEVARSKLDRDSDRA
jgi:tetratricopeptide (TPR) repeat protein